MKKKTTTLFHLSLLTALFLATSSLFSGAAAQEHRRSSHIVSHGPLSDQEALYIKHRQLLYYRDEFGDRGEHVTVDPSLVFENDRLRNAYIALQALKQAILSDPFNITGNWVGSNVCKYTGVFCTKALDNRTIRTVVGIDLNHGDIVGYLPEMIGGMVSLEQLNVAHNLLSGKIPASICSLPSLQNFTYSYG